MARSINTRTKYRIVGSDYSAQEPRCTGHLSKDPGFIKAYQEGKDLYALIAQSAFNNNYEDNLEFYVPGTEVELDGKKSISGTGAEYSVATDETNSVILPFYDMIVDINSEVTVRDVAIGSTFQDHEVIDKTELPDHTVKLTFNTAVPDLSIKSPAKILNKSGKERRSVGKVLLLAACYGMGGKTAGSKMGKTAEEGQALLDNFFKGFPGVKAAIDESRQLLQKYGYVEDFIGRRRHLPEIYLPNYEVTIKNPVSSDEDFNPIIGCSNRITVDPRIKKWETAVQLQVDKSQAWQSKKAMEKGQTWTPNGEMSMMSFEKLAKEASADGVIISANTGKKAQATRQCFNARIQGSAASLTKLAMVNIAKDSILNECQTKLIIPVHDELLVECPEYYADVVETRLAQVMIEAAAPYIKEIPMKCDPYNVSRWYVDEYSVAVKEDYKKLLKTIDKELARQQIKDKYCEIPEQAINELLDGKTDVLNF